MKKTIFVDKLPGFEDVEPNMYLLHSEGGPHYFSQCTIDVDPIYKKNIWPYLERVKGHPSLKSNFGKKLAACWSLGRSVVRLCAI